MENQQTEEGLVGISFRENQLRMTEAIGSPGHCRIAKIARGISRIPFSFSSLKDRNNIHTLAQDINRVYETAGFSSNSASLSLDSDMVLIKKVPVDASLQAEELKEHLFWEVSQFVINPLDNFVIDFEILRPESEAAQETMAIVVVVRKAVIDYIKEIFASTDLYLKAIDVDVFAAQRVLAKNHNFPPDSKIALIDIRNKDLQISILHNNFYLAQDVDYPVEENAGMESDRDEHIARVISKELRRIILDNKLGKSVEDMQEIFIYGDEVEERIIDILAKAHNVNFHRINPFENIPTTDTSADPEMKHHPETYVTSVGAAIKGF